MRELGLIVTFGAAALVACRGAPEPVPAEASAPTVAAPPEPSTPSAAAAGSAPSAATPRVYGEGTKSVSAKPGERFGIALESNVTLPFKWRLDPPDAKVLALIDEKQHEGPPSGCSDCVGTSGTKVFSFEAKAAGNATLHFALKPLTEPAGQSQKDVTVSVTVAP